MSLDMFFGLPLHPIVVHFPIAMALLMPILGFFIISRNPAMSRSVWMAVLALQIIFSVSAFVGLKTGEAQEDRVEKVTGKEAIHEHEEAAEKLMIASLVTTLMSALVFWKPQKRGFQWAYLVLAVLVWVPAMLTGHSGGELVYEKGAGSAYTKPATP